MNRTTDSPSNNSLHSQMECDSSTDGASRSTSSNQDTSQILHPFQFPWRLHEMLEAADKEGYTSIVSWLPDEKSFKVHMQEAFVNHIMPRYFNQTKYRSFQRQLNVWGFERVADGPGRGGYTHAWFIRSKPSLCHNMKRERTKGTKKSKQATKTRSNCTAPPSCITTQSFEQVGNFSAGIVIDQCLNETGSQDKLPSRTQDDDLEDWFLNMGKQDCDKQHETLKQQPPATQKELGKQFLRTFSIEKQALTKDQLFRYQDLKYIMIGLKWGNSIFDQYNIGQPGILRRFCLENNSSSLSASTNKL